MEIFLLQKLFGTIISLVGSSLIHTTNFTVAYTYLYKEYHPSIRFTGFFFSFLFFYLVFLEKHGNKLETNMEFCWIFTFNRGSIVMHNYFYFEII